MKATERIKDIVGPLLHCKHCREELATILIDVEILVAAAEIYHEVTSVATWGLSMTESAKARIFRKGKGLESAIEAVRGKP